MRVLVSGGGTAGHIYPALTVAEKLVAERDEVTFVGTPDGLEARVVPGAGIDFVALKAKGYDRARPVTFVTSSVLILASSVRAYGLMRRLKPDVVIGFGGYVSLPVGLAARLSGTPLVLHEQNSVPGLANRVLSRWASGIGVTYEGSRAYLKRPERAVLTGNPVRAQVLASDRAGGRARFGVSDDELLLLVFGGSRGARHLNRAVLALRDRLLGLERLRVLQIAGRAEIEEVTRTLSESGGGANGRWSVVDYLEDMGAAMAAADLVVSRAGATSIAEITALGRPAVLVPFPFATDDHQTKNALGCVDAGAAVLVSDDELDSDRFGDVLAAVLGDPEQRATMAAASRALGRPDAADRVVSLARQVLARTA